MPRCLQDPLRLTAPHLAMDAVLEFFYNYHLVFVLEVVTIGLMMEVVLLLSRL